MQRFDSLDCGGRWIGHEQPCYIIAEAGVNHQGDLDLACRMVDEAARAGADAIKFQTFNADRLVTAKAPKAAYQQRGDAVNESQLDMLRRLELSPSDHATLWQCCRDHGIQFLSSPFDEQAADFLANLGVPAFKLPSGELVNHHFLRHVAAFGKPLFLSTGMASLGEVEEAVATARGPGGLALLHCVSLYPAPPETTNLRAMDTLRQCFGLPTGYSDHTLGVDIPVAAVARGACILEKHFTLDTSLPGPDHAASLTPEALGQMVTAIRRVESALGDGRKRPASGEGAIAAIVRKSLTAAVDIAAGTQITGDMLVLKRPGDGLPASLLDLVVGRRAARDIAKNVKLTLDDLA